MNKLMSTTLLLIALAVSLAVHLALSLSRFIPTPWNLLGILPLAAGVAINLVADRAFHQAESTVKPFERSTTLVPDGVFRYIRNLM